MQDIARQAGVAVGTLYRYFPSKAWLFAVLFETKVDEFAERHRSGTCTGQPAESIGQTLVDLNRSLLEQPVLASAMVQSTLAGFAGTTQHSADWVRSGRVESALVSMTVDMVGDPLDERLQSAARLLIYSWWGVFVSTVTGRSSVVRAEGDLRRAAELLLASWSSAGPAR